MKNTNPCKRYAVAALVTGTLSLSGLSITAPESKQTTVIFGPSAVWADKDVLDRVEDRIDRAFKNDRVLRRYDLDVDEEDNHIEIKGTVRTAAQRARAQSIARSLTPKRHRVVNKIRIRR